MTISITVSAAVLFLILLAVCYAIRGARDILINVALCLAITFFAIQLFWSSGK